MPNYLDPCLMYLQEAVSTSNNYVELSTYQMIFEAESGDDVDKTLKNNEKVVEKSDSALKNACTAVKNLINNLITKIKDFIDKVTLGKTQKNKYKEFLDKAVKDPASKNKKITVSDWKKIEASYDNALKEVEAEIRATKQKNKENIESSVDEFFTRIKRGIANTIKTSSVVVPMNIAKNIANSSMESASLMLPLLRDEGVVMNTIESTVGKSGAKDFKKSIKKSSRLISLHRFKVFLFGEKFKSAKDCFYGVIKDINKISKNPANIITTGVGQDAIQATNPDKSKLENNARATVLAAKTAKHALKAEHMVKTAKKRKDNLKNFWTN